MTISQQQIVDYLYKKIGYGVAKTDTPTNKSPSNEGNASPLLSTAEGIWQSSSSIPATKPNSNTSVVTLHKDSLATTVVATVDPTTAIVNETWFTGLTDWIPPQFGATYQVKIYTAPPGTVNPETVGTLLPPDGSGNNDAWFFDYQAGIVNFMDTNVPASVAGNVIYVVGARYTGGKGISNFPNGLTASNYYFSNGQSILSSISGTYGNANVAAYLTQSTPITITSGTEATGANTGVFQVWGGASIGANLYVGGNLILKGNTYAVQTQELQATNVYATAYFYANGTPFNYGNVQVASFLAGYTGSLNNSSSYQVLLANAANQGASINQINSQLLIADANLGVTSTKLQTLHANVGAYEIWANSYFAPSTGGTIAGISANLGAYQTWANTAINQVNSNVSTISANLGAYELYANANLGTAYNNINTLLINAAVQGSQIAGLAGGLNANIASYLVSTPITIGTTNYPTSVGGNLTVGGNLIVQGNVYELQTEIITQSEVVAGNVYAGNYFFANGEAFGVYGNTQVGQYLLNYPGNISANVMTANTMNVRGTFTVSNITTTGRWGDISGANLILANTYAFAGNGVSILSAIPASYTDANVAAYLPTYSGLFNASTVTTTNIRATNYLYANGVSILSGVGTYGNSNVAAYLPTNTTNVGASLLTASAILVNGNITSTGQQVQFISGNASTGILSGNLSLPVNNPYSFNGSYALSTTTPTAQNTLGNVSLQLGGQSFCVQFWMYLTSSPASNPIVFGKDQNTITAPIEYYATVTTSGINFSTTAGYNVAGSYSFTPQINTWYHVAWTSDGTNYRVFLNGQMGTPVLVSGGTITNSTGPLYVGASARQTNYFSGYIEDFRIDRGVANYTSSFPVPTNYVGTGPNTVFYLKSWTAGSGVAAYWDQTVAANGAIGYYNIRMVSTTSPAVVTTVGPYNTTTSGQALYYDGAYNWYSTGGFRVRGTTPALSVESGAFQVAGGAGIVGNLYAGNISTTGSLTGSSVTATSVTSSIVSSGLYTYANGVNILNGVAGTYGNANVAAYLPTYTGDLKGTIVSASLYTYANGVNILNGIGGTYTNANVTSYLPIHSGQISASAYFYSNGTPLNYGNVQVAAYLPTHTGNVNGAYLFGNLVSIGTSTVVGNISTIGSGGNITGANVISANTYTYANGVNILTGVGGIYSNANVTALLASITPTTIGGNLNVTGNLIIQGNVYELQTEIISQNEVVAGSIYAASYYYSNGAPFTTSTYSNSNVSAYLSTYTGTLSNSSDIVALYANAATQSTAIDNLTANVNAGQANAAIQAVAISSLATNANANTAAYLTTFGGNIAAGTVTTTGNLTVGGNLIIQGNVYELQTEIISQNEIVAGSIYAASYYYSNGAPFTTSTYSNANVGAYISVYSGTVSAGNVYSGGYFYANGTPFNYGNVQAQAYFSTYSGNMSAGAYFYANGAPLNYGNVQVAAYLLTNTGNVASNHFIGNVHADSITSIHGNVVLEPSGSGVAVVNATTALQLPKGTTAQRPPGGPGYIRFNTEGNSLEFFDGGAWVAAVNSITQQNITGDDTTKTFNLNQLTTSVGILVSINGTVQQPDVAYTVSGTQITFAEAPHSTDVIDVRFIVSASATIVDTVVVDSGKTQVDTVATTLDSWPIVNYRSAKYTVSSSTGSQSQVSDVWITHDGSNSFISNTTLKTGADTLHFTTSVVVGNVVLQAYSTTTNNQVRIQRTYFEI